MALVRSLSANAGERPLIPARVIRAREPGVPIPVSFQQRRLWVLDQLDRGNPSLQHARGA